MSSELSGYSVSSDTADLNLGTLFAGNGVTVSRLTKSSEILVGGVNDDDDKSLLDEVMLGNIRSDRQILLLCMVTLSVAISCDLVTPLCKKSFKLYPAETNITWLLWTIGIDHY